MKNITLKTAIHPVKPEFVMRYRQNFPLLPPCVVPEEDLCVLLPPELLLLSGFAVRVTVW